MVNVVGVGLARNAMLGDKVIQDNNAAFDDAPLLGRVNIFPSLRHIPRKVSPRRRPLHQDARQCTPPLVQCVRNDGF